MGASKSPFRDKQVSDPPCVTYGRLNVGNDGPCQFETEVEVTAAMLIAGAVTVLPDASVPRNCKVYLRDYQFRWGSTAFATASNIFLSDTNASPVDFVTVTVGAAASAIHRFSPTGVTQTNVTQGAALIGPADGGTTGKGLQVRTNVAPTLGSTFRVYVRGFFAE